MKTIYFDLQMGAAGDMLSAALFELLNDEEKKEFLDKINAAGIPGVEVAAEASVKCGITGTHFKVTVDGKEEESHDAHHHHEHGPSTSSGTAEHEHGGVPALRQAQEPHSEGHHHDHHHEHHHTSLHDIEHLVNDLKLSDAVKKNVLAVYNLIAQAESHAHGKPVTDIHFHEVGTMDAVADITAVCLLIEILNPERIIASAVNVGSGQVHCAHGILPVPAPATAFILQGVPSYSNQIKGELCTPTGAALLKHFVKSFGPMTTITTEQIGYGMGKKDFEAANCVRAIMGDISRDYQSVVEFTCNLDDISAERIGFAIERLFEAGAVEAYTIPVTMKKSRPGNLLCVMCFEENKQKVLEAIFKHTTTLGVRQNISQRYALDRTIETVQTEFGPVRIKKAEGFGVERQKYEYEDLARIARETGKSISEIEHVIASGAKQSTL
ncbi:MAG: nickel pincer cofactor biosynthesis protein LarC [Treponema sp.]|nr:nickel pincer cofactor biosynthesis protein LarC [Treponema sp.]